MLFLSICLYVATIPTAVSFLYALAGEPFDWIGRACLFILGLIWPAALPFLVLLYLAIAAQVLLCRAACWLGWLVRDWLPGVDKVL